MSPAKGILLTPGTAATRRKTVSFGSLESSNEGEIEEADQIAQTAIPSSGKVSDTVSPEEPKFDPQSQRTFTKELFEAQLGASKQRLSEHHESTEITAREGSSSDNAQLGKALPVQSTAVDAAVDATIDLTKPRSQSGQHWKAEYERYQRNSDRELKKIIQYGQSVKSYAEKKDVEATDLQEKLKHELAKCTAMEAKVSKLATQLANGRRHGSDGFAEQEKLMNDLSRQTALAIRYKQRADRYRVAIKQQQSSSVGDMHENHGNGTET